VHENGLAEGLNDLKFSLKRRLKPTLQAEACATRRPRHY